MKSGKDFQMIRNGLLLFFVLLVVNSLSAQQNKGVPGVEVMKTYTQVVLGTNVGFYVEIKNNHDVPFDALEYTVYYYDGFEEKMGEKDFKWQSGNIVKSIESGKILKDYRANWIKGANKIKVVITRVHFTNGKIITADII
jgi:hypothetical protein